MRRGKIMSKKQNASHEHGDNNKTEENINSSTLPNLEPTTWYGSFKNFISNVKGEVTESIGDTWYYGYAASIGAATAIPLPYIGMINPPLAAVLIAAPLLLASQEASHTTDSDHEWTHHNHELMTKGIYGSGLAYFTSRSLTSTTFSPISTYDEKPLSSSAGESNRLVSPIDNAKALMTVGAVTFFTVLFEGEGSIIDHIEDKTVAVLDWALHDWI
jgi:hypothetical protein